jgi:hypothetical protein
VAGAVTTVWDQSRGDWRDCRADDAAAIAACKRPPHRSLSNPVPDQDPFFTGWPAEEGDGGWSGARG